MKKVICLSIILFFISTVIFAQQKNIDKWTQIVIDALDYDENGIPINIYDIEMALKNGANPNYISEEGNSFLTYLSYYTSEYENNDIKNKIIKAYKLLFNHGAKLQYVDRSILYFPIVNGCYEVIKLLLENGASATFWPTDEIGSDITPIELATAKGHEDIITLLESYGAERLGKQESAQLRFIEASQFGTIDEMEEARKKGAIVNKKIDKTKQH